MAKTRKVPPPLPVSERSDDWQNAVTGLGVLGYDKRLGSNFVATLLAQEFTEELWRGDDVFARMVETVPNEMLRKGVDWLIENEKEDTEALEQKARDLAVIENIRTGLYYARAYGGAGLLLGVDDGEKDLSKPLREDRIRSFTHLTPFTPRELQPVEWYSDPLKPRYGDIAVYRLVPINAPPGTVTVQIPLVHETRIVRIAGVRTSRRAMLRNTMPGWDDSIGVRTLQVINDFQHAWQGASVILQDFAPPVLKLKGLAELLAQQSGTQGVENRAKAIEAARSIARVTLLDSEEEYTRETVNVTGYADLLEKLMLRLAAAAGMPVSLLMGQSPAGLNATGDSDIRWFYDSIAAMQERVLRPVCTRILKLMLLSKDGPTHGQLPENWSVYFSPLWQMTEAEQATIRNTQANTDKIYLEAQVVTPTEVGMSRFGGDQYSWDTSIDVELREQLQEDEELQLAELGAHPEGGPNAGPGAPPPVGADPEAGPTSPDMEPHFSQSTTGNPGDVPEASQPGTKTTGGAPNEPEDKSGQSAAVQVHVHLPPSGGVAPPENKKEKKDDVAELHLDFVRQRGKKWVVLSRAGKVLGTHPTKEAAEAQLRAIESAKAGR